MDPITRKEMFLAKAGGQDVNTPPPITREEMFLNKIGAPSWNDLKDKPFGEMPTGGDTLYWDGNTEGLVEVVSDVGNFYKVSDVVLTEEELLNDVADSLGAGSLRCGNEGGFTFKSSSKDETSGMFAELGFGVIAEYIFCASTDNYEIPAFGTILPEKGIYFRADIRYFYVATCTRFPKIKKIDQKYLPLLKSPLGKQFKLTVDDNGTITATEV